MLFRSRGSRRSWRWAAMVDDALFDDGDEVKYGAEGEGGEGHLEEVLPAADQHENSVEETDRVQGGRHAEPDDAQFSHGRIGNVES